MAFRDELRAAGYEPRTGTDDPVQPGAPNQVQPPSFYDQMRSFGLQPRTAPVQPVEPADQPSAFETFVTEDIPTAFRRTLPLVGGSLTSAVEGAQRVFADVTGNEELSQKLDADAFYTQRAKEIINEELPLQTKGGEVLSSALQSAALSAPALAIGPAAAAARGLGFVTGTTGRTAATALPAALGTQVGLETFAEKRAQGVEPLTAAGAAITSGGAEFAFERIALDKFFDLISGGKRNFIGNLGRYLGAEVATELPTTVVQSMADILFDKGDVTERARRAAQYLANEQVETSAGVTHQIVPELVDTALVATTQAGLMGGAGITLQRGAEVASDTLLASNILGERRTLGAQARNLGVDKEALRSRINTLLEYKQANPDFDLKSPLAKQHLQGAVIFKDGEFVEAPQEQPAAEAGLQPQQPEVEAPQIPAVTQERIEELAPQAPEEREQAESLVQRIVAGEQVEAPEDVQTYQNNTEFIEARLQQERDAAAPAPEVTELPPIREGETIARETPLEGGRVRRTYQKEFDSPEAADEYVAAFENRIGVQRSVDDGRVTAQVTVAEEAPQPEEAPARELDGSVQELVQEPTTQEISDATQAGQQREDVRAEPGRVDAVVPEDGQDRVVPTGLDEGSTQAGVGDRVRPEAQELVTPLAPEERTRLQELQVREFAAPLPPEEEAELTSLEARDAAQQEPTFARRELPTATRVELEQLGIEPARISQAPADFTFPPALEGATPVARRTFADRIIQEEIDGLRRIEQRREAAARQSPRPEVAAEGQQPVAQDAAVFQELSRESGWLTEIARTLRFDLTEDGRPSEANGRYLQEMLAIPEVGDALRAQFRAMGLQVNNAGAREFTQRMAQAIEFAEQEGLVDLDFIRGEPSLTRDFSTPEPDLFDTDISELPPAIQQLHRGMETYLNTQLESGTYTLGNAPQGQADLFTQMESLLNKRIVFFRANNDPTRAQGVTNIAADTIYINEAASDPHLYILGHETLHELKRDSPELYGELVQTLKSMIPIKDILERANRLNDYRRQDGLQPWSMEVARDKAVEEYVADFFGEQFMEPAFWNRLQQRNPTGFARLVEILNDLIERIKSLFSGTALRNMEEAQNAAVRALDRYVRRNPGEVYQPPLPEFTEQTFSRMDEAARNGLDNLKRQLRAALNPNNLTELRPTLLKVTPLPIMSQIYSEVVPRVTQYERAVTRERVVRQSITDDAAVAANRARELAGEGVGVEVLNKALELGSLYQMTPWETRLNQDWVPREGTAGARLAAARIAWIEAGMDQTTGRSYDEAYREARAAFDALESRDLQGAYIDVVDSLAQTFTREKNAMFRMIESVTEEGSEQRQELLDRLDASMQPLKGAYVPLDRNGNYMLSYTDPEGFAVVERFETETEAKLIQEEMVQMGATNLRLTKDDLQDRQLAAIPREFMEQIQNAVRAQAMEGVNPEDQQEVQFAQESIDTVINSINEIFLRWTPETSALKNSIRRRSVRGYSSDMLRGYIKYMTKHAANIAYFEQGRQVEDILKEIKNDIRAKSEAQIEETGQSNTVVETDVLNDLRARTVAIRTASMDKLSTLLAKTSTLWYLSSPSIALVQMSQLGVLTFPKLSTMVGSDGSTLFGPTQTGRALVNGINKGLRPSYNREAMYTFAGDNVTDQLYKDMNEVVTPQNRNTDRAEGKELGEAMYSNEEINERVAALSPYQQELLALRDAMDRGILDISLFHEAQALANGADPNATPSKVSNIMLSALKHSELLSRKSTILATYNMAQAKGMPFTEAMDTAEFVVRDTLFDYSPEAKGEWLLKAPVRVLMAFQHYRIMLHGKLMMLVRDMIKNETPEVRRAATKEMIGIMGMTAALAGATGVPMASWAFMMMDFMLGDEDEPVNSELMFQNILEEAAGREVAQAVGYGLPTLLGANISRRVGAQGFLHAEISPPASAHGDAWLAHVATQALGPAYSVIAGFAKGKAYLDDGEYLRALEASMPKPVKDVSKAIRFASDGVKTAGGKRLLEEGEIGIDELILTMVGFNPDEVFRASSREWWFRDLSTRISSRRGEIAERIAEAYTGDGDLDEALEEMRTFNERAPLFRVDATAIRSALGRKIKGDLMIDGRRDRLIELKYGQ